MNKSKITMSRPLNVPIGGRSIRTRRKYSSAPLITSVTPTTRTPNSVIVCCRSEIGSVMVGMSRSHEYGLAGKGGLAQVAPGLAQGPRLVVVDDRQVHVRAAERLGQVAARRRLAEPCDRGGGQDEPELTVIGPGAVTRGPGLRGQRLDGVD